MPVLNVALVVVGVQNAVHESMLKFLRSMELEGRASTVPTYRRALERYDGWLTQNGVDVAAVAFDVLLSFQRWLAEEYRRPNDRKALKRSTQATWLSAVKAFHGWCYRRGLSVHDPARGLKLPKIKRTFVVAAHLNQQEATAIIQTQAGIVSAKKEGTRQWAAEFRNLAMLSLALATGRRRESLLSLRVKDLDFERKEVRIEWEKGRPGRVLPCAAWAMALALEYIKRARPAIAARPDPGWLFAGVRTPRVCGEYLGRLLVQVQAKTVEANPDLEELAEKELSSHSLRVTFATLMFLNGAGIRVVNELLLHRQISTTARYTPLELDDLRRACRLAHPRA